MSFVYILIAGTGLVLGSYLETWRTKSFKIIAQAYKTSEVEFSYPVRDVVIKYDNNLRISYNHQKRIPNWVYERITRERKVREESIKKQPYKCRPEKLIYPKFSSYNSDFLQAEDIGRGHMATASHFKDSIFPHYLTNIAPQYKIFNKYAWNDLEMYAIYVLNGYESIQIWSGPLFLPKQESDGRWYVTYEIIGDNDVAVPTHFFKVMAFEKSNGSYVIESFIMPNKKVPFEHELKEYCTYMNNVTNLSGFEMFPNQFLKSTESINPMRFGRKQYYHYDKGPELTESTELTPRQLRLLEKRKKDHEWELKELEIQYYRKERRRNELKRQIDENTRQHNEEISEQIEVESYKNDQIRISNYNKSLNVDNRIESKSEAELNKMDVEMQDNETKRANNEAKRIENERERKEMENKRRESEKERDDNEEKRNNYEEIRKSNEEIRKNNNKTRVKTKKPGINEREKQMSTVSETEKQTIIPSKLVINKDKQKVQETDQIKQKEENMPKMKEMSQNEQDSQDKQETEGINEQAMQKIELNMLATPELNPDEQFVTLKIDLNKQATQETNPDQHETQSADYYWTQNGDYCYLYRYSNDEEQYNDQERDKDDFKEMGQNEQPTQKMDQKKQPTQEMGQKKQPTPKMGQKKQPTPKIGQKKQPRQEINQKKQHMQQMDQNEPTLKGINQLKQEINKMIQDERKVQKLNQDKNKQKPQSDQQKETSQDSKNAEQNTEKKVKKTIEKSKSVSKIEENKLDTSQNKQGTPSEKKRKRKSAKQTETPNKTMNKVCESEKIQETNQNKQETPCNKKKSQSVGLKKPENDEQKENKAVN